MAKMYRLADHTVMDLLREVITEHHPDLEEAHVSIGVLMISLPERDDGAPPPPALTVGGWPALASVKITPLDQRALGMPDAVIRVDAFRWENMDEAQQRALLDHECCHLGVTIGEDEARTIKSDSCDRPVLSMRDHDWRVEGFTEIIQRHGRNAPEQALVDSFTTTMEQAELPLGGVATAAEKSKRKRAAVAPVRAVEAAAPDPVEAEDDAHEGPPPRRSPTRGMLEAVGGA